MKLPGWIEAENGKAYTEAILGSGQSKYKAQIDAGAEIKFIRGGNLTYKADQDEPGKFWIEGYPSTNDIDRGNDIVSPKAFAGTMQEFMKNPVMLLNHDWYALPIGKWTEFEIRPNGLFMRGFIAMDTSAGHDTIVLVLLTILKSLSIGFRVVHDEFDYNTEIRTITDLELYEVSVVNIPMNPYALFQPAGKND